MKIVLDSLCVRFLWYTCTAFPDEVAATQISVFKKQLQDYKEEIGTLKSGIQRVNVELSQYQAKYRPLTNAEVCSGYVVMSLSLIVRDLLLMILFNLPSWLRVVCRSFFNWEFEIIADNSENWESRITVTWSGEENYWALKGGVKTCQMWTENECSKWSLTRLWKKSQEHWTCLTNHCPTHQSKPAVKKLCVNWKQIVIKLLTLLYLTFVYLFCFYKEGTLQISDLY